MAVGGKAERRGRIPAGASPRTRDLPDAERDAVEDWP